MNPRHVSLARGAGRAGRSPLPAAQTSFMPVDEVRPGMVGIGRTVFEGNKIEEFKVHILGVLKNVVGPRATSCWRGSKAGRSQRPASLPA